MALTNLDKPKGGRWQVGQNVNVSPQSTALKSSQMPVRHPPYDDDGGGDDDDDAAATESFVLRKNTITGQEESRWLASR